MLQKDNNNIERESQAGSYNDDVRAVGGGVGLSFLTSVISYT